MNAIRGVVPFSDDSYGVGLFTSSAFLNHACQPNAILAVQPNQVHLYALTKIEAGDEITVSYQELPLEMMAPDLVRTLHMRSGAIVNAWGCCCEICRIHWDDESQALREAGQDPEAGREVTLNLESMFMAETSQRLKLDRRLLTYVMAMLNASGDEDGMHASNGLRMYYDQFLRPPTEEEDKRPVAEASDESSQSSASSSFCPDLAYVMANIYCRSTIHYPDQEADNYLFWTALYHDLLRRTAINMPKTMCDALGARCYAALLISAKLGREDLEGQRVTLDIFLTAWILLRAMHMGLYDTVAFLTVICQAYPNIGDMVQRYGKRIARKELEIQLRMGQEQAAALAQEQAPDVAQGQAPDVGPPEMVPVRDIEEECRQEYARASLQWEEALRGSFRFGTLDQYDSLQIAWHQLNDACERSTGQPRPVPPERHTILADGVVVPLSQAEVMGKEPLDRGAKGE